MIERALAAGPLRMPEPAICKRERPPRTELAELDERSSSCSTDYARSHASMRVPLQLVDEI